MNGFTHESSYNESKEWYTPKYIFDALGLEFDLDPCSPGMDIVPWVPAKKCYTVIEDGLSQKWEGLVWMNPPYGQDTPKWMKKLSIHGNGIALVFSRTDTEWFHEYCTKSSAVCFIKKRVSFIQSGDVGLFGKGVCEAKGSSGAGSMLVAYGAIAKQAVIDSELGGVFVYNDNIKKKIVR